MISLKALDIETIPNVDLIDYLPEPDISFGNIKDPEKIKEKIVAAKQKTIEKMALSPLYGRICSFAIFGDVEYGGFFKVMNEISDAEEIGLITEIFNSISICGETTNRIITWNGFAFDFPFIFKRAAILKIQLPTNCPGLRFWCKKYQMENHCDLMQELGGWSIENRISLNEASKIFLGKTKEDMDYSKFPELIKTGKGNLIGLYNLKDSEFTYDLYNMLSPYLFQGELRWE
jgi:DNA polymerase elongation subunit (family B)